MPSILSVVALRTALEVGAVYSLVAIALFISFSILNIADLSTDGCYTLGFAVGATVTLAGHPFLALPAAMAAGACSGFVSAFLQTRLGVESILAGIIVNTGLYTVNLAVMGWSSNLSIFGRLYLHHRQGSERRWLVAEVACAGRSGDHSSDSGSIGGCLLPYPVRPVHPCHGG